MSKPQRTYDEQVYLVELGKRFEKALKRRGLNQNQAAKVLKVDRARISQIINGYPVNPIGTLLLWRACRTFKISADYLLGIPRKKKPR